MPLLLFNPVGTIRKGVQEQPHDPKGRIELIAYALPAYLLNAALGFLGALIVQLVSGTLSIGSIVPIGPLIGAVVGAVVTGFIWHPVLKWWVNFVKGNSDARSRTNLFMLYMTAFALIALPNFVAQLLRLVRLPMIGLIPLLLSLATSLLTLFIYFVWFTEAQVVKWFRIVLMVLGGLACLGTLAGLPAALRGAPSISTATPAVPDLEDAKAAAAKAAADAEAPGSDSDEKPRANAKTGGDAKAAAGSKAGADAKPSSEGKSVDTKPAAHNDEKAADKVAESAPSKASKAAAEKATENDDAEKNAAPAAKAGPKEVARADTAKPTETQAEESAPGSANTGYRAWRTELDAIEKRVSDDPTLIAKNSELLSQYKTLQENIYEIETKFQKTNKKPADRRVNEHLRNAELYEKTQKQVHALHQRMFK
jgi:hypothetical protein